MTITNTKQRHTYHKFQDKEGSLPSRQNLAINLSPISKRLLTFFSVSKTHQFDYLYGINPVQCALHANRRHFQSLYLSDSEHIELSSRTAKMMQLAKSTSIPIIFTHKDKLSRMVKQQPHQNIVLKCSPLELLPIKNGHSFNPGVYVFCDKVTDPQNFGAILRSCLFFGVEAVFTGKKNHCPLNPTVSKASAGAAELIPTHLVQNSSEFLSNWKKQGGSVIATTVDESKPHTAAHSLKPIILHEKIQKVLVIIGSEYQGVSPHLVSASDYCVSIQRQGQKDHPFTLIDSMNVSAALSVVLFQLTKPM